MKWFRFYSSVAFDPKVMALDTETRWMWITLLCIASENNPRGDLPPLAGIAGCLRMPLGELTAMIEKLVDARLIECNGNETFHVHNWDERQYKSDISTERVHEHRERTKHRHKPNGAKKKGCKKRNVSETPPDPETETEEKSSSPTPPARDDDDTSAPPQGANPDCWAAAVRRSKRLKAPPADLRSWLWTTARDYARCGIPPEPAPPPERTYHRADPAYVVAYQARLEKPERSRPPPGRPVERQLAELAERFKAP